MSRENTSLPQAIFDTPRTPSTKTIPAAGKESRFRFLRPLSTRIPAGPAQDFGQDTNRNPGRTKVGLPTRTPTTSPRKDARKARKRPRKGPKRPRRARPAGPHKAQRKGQRKATKGHQKPTTKPAAAAGANQQPDSRKKGPERPTGGHRQGQRYKTTAPPQRPRKGPRKARERPPREAQPRAAFGCRVEECRTVSDSKPVVVDTVRETSTCRVW